MKISTENMKCSLANYATVAELNISFTFIEHPVKKKKEFWFPW